MSKLKNDGGIIYFIWRLIFSLLLGFSVGTLIISGTGYLLGKFSGSDGLSDKAVTVGEADISAKEVKGMGAFVASNPFKVSPQKKDVPPPEPPKEEAKPVTPDTTLDEVILRGTLPGVGAWFEIKNNLKLILVGRNIDSYRLQSVSYAKAVFRKGEEPPVSKYIVYGPVEASKPDAPKPSAPAPAPAAQTPAPVSPNNMGTIIAAVPGTTEGQIPGEMVSNMVQNPFDELKRIRIRPNEKAGSLEVQWIQNDSLLKRLGVQRGDVIRSVNGIPFTNMGDIANSLNSLMSSERFDVEVTRGGKPTALRYVVR